MGWGRAGKPLGCWRCDHEAKVRSLEHRYRLVWSVGSGRKLPGQERSRIHHNTSYGALSSTWLYKAVSLLTVSFSWWQSRFFGRHGRVRMQAELSGWNRQAG